MVDEGALGKTSCSWLVDVFSGPDIRCLDRVAGSGGERWTAVTMMRVPATLVG